MRTLLLTMVFSVFVFSPKAKAHDPLELRRPAACMDELESSSLAPPELPARDKNEIFDPKSLNELLPKQISREDKGAVVMSRIADNGLKKIMASDSFRNSQFGELNEKVQENTKIEMSLKDTDNRLEHRLNAQVQPFQGMAVLSYKGYFGLDYSFQPAGDTQKIKLEEVILHKKVFFENRQVHSQTLNQIGVAWDW